MKKYILAVCILVAVVGVAAYSGFLFGKGAESKNQNSVSGQNALATSAVPEYFDDSAKVMFFYSDYCGWCQKQKEVLKSIAIDGYKVKPMDVGEYPDYWQLYNIEGTPTFVAPDGKRMVGYQKAEELKAFLDLYK